jgi:hypothetical protein
MRGLGIGIVVTAILMGIALPTRKESLSDEEIRQRALAMGMVEENGVLADDLGKEDENETAAEDTQENTVSENDETTVPETDTAEVETTEEKEAAATAADAEKAEAKATAADAEKAEAKATAADAEKAEAKTTADKSQDTKVQKENAIEETVEVIQNEETDETEAANTAEASNPQTAHVSAVITIQSGDGSRTAAYKLQGAGVIDDIAEFDSFLCRNGYDKKLATGDHEITAGASWEEIAKELTRRNR